MMFSPISERSARVRALYLSLYAVLSLGALTMILPFLIMVSGSVESQVGRPETSLFPRYLVDDSALWERYLEAKYWGVPDNLRQAWGDFGVAFETATLPDAHAEDRRSVALWKEFLRETPLDGRHFAMGFLRPGRRMPSETERVFRKWLLIRYGSLEGVNLSLEKEFSNVLQIAPPAAGFLAVSSRPTAFAQDFDTFADKQPQERKFAWNVGGYFRGVFLPRSVGRNVDDYNAKYGTSYRSYAEVPFPATAPREGLESWWFFVQKILSPNFIGLTGEGEAALQASALEKDEFIRTRARPGHIKVVSLDARYSDWCSSRGIENGKIPQRALDLSAFEKEKGFWKMRFVVLNYLFVIDQIALHGRALYNTLILVAISIIGSLLINPLAAYALSRFKLKVSYHLLLFFLATIAFPAEVTMIPVFLQLKELNLLNTFAALVLPTVASGFSIFLLKGFFDSLPRELYEAAEIDGASEWTVFWQVTMNLSKPILAVLALEAFVSAYGAFFFALVIAPDPQMWTLMVYIYQLRQNVDAPVVYASLILSAIPTLLVFVFCQKIILRGIVVPSEK